MIMSESLPYWPVVPALSPSPWYTLQLDLLRCLWAVLLPACLWGASFPLALMAVASPGQDPGRLAGGSMRPIRSAPSPAPWFSAWC